MRRFATMSMLVCVALAGALLPAAGRAAAQPNGAATLASNMAAASADAAQLAGEVTLPAGAQRLNAEPSGDDEQLEPATHLPPALIGAVDTSWWQVPRATPRQVITAIQATPPPGATFSPDDDSNGRSPANVLFSFAEVPGVLDSRMVAVTAAALSGGGTGVLVESQSVWVVPRMADSLIPAATRVISVGETAHGGKLLRSATVTKARRVRAARAFFNGLQPVQPFIINCPVESLALSDAVTVKFLSRKGAAPLATASFSGDLGLPGNGISDACSGVLLRVGSRTRVYLIGGTYISTLNRLLGTHIP